MHSVTSTECPQCARSHTRGWRSSDCMRQVQHRASARWSLKGQSRSPMPQLLPPHTTNKRWSLAFMITTGQLDRHLLSDAHGYRAHGTLQISKLRHGELGQEHTACLWQSWIQTRENHTFWGTLLQQELLFSQ